MIWHKKLRNKVKEHNSLKVLTKAGEAVSAEEMARAGDSESSNLICLGTLNHQGTNRGFWDVNSSRLHLGAQQCSIVLREELQKLVFNVPPDKCMLLSLKLNPQLFLTARLPLKLQYHNWLAGSGRLGQARASRISLDRDRQGRTGSQQGLVVKVTRDSFSKPFLWSHQSEDRTKSFHPLLVVKVPQTLR